MSTLLFVSRILVNFLSFLEQSGTSALLLMELFPFGGFIGVAPCSVKFVFNKLFSYQIKTEFSRVAFLCGSLLYVRIASTSRPASPLALALVLALSLALSRLGLAQVLAVALFLALSEPVVSLLLSFGRGSWGFLSIRVASTLRLASLLALALVLALSVALSRPVLAQALALSLALSGPVVSPLLSFGR